MNNIFILFCFKINFSVRRSIQNIFEISFIIILTKFYAIQKSVFLSYEIAKSILINCHMVREKHMVFNNKLMIIAIKYTYVCKIKWYKLNLMCVIRCFVIQFSIHINVYWNPNNGRFNWFTMTRVRYLCI